MRRKRKSRLAAALELAAVITATAILFIMARASAYEWRGYEAIGGEAFVLLLPIIYYEFKRIVGDFLRDFAELYRNAPEE